MRTFILLVTNLVLLVYASGCIPGAPRHVEDTTLQPKPAENTTAQIMTVKPVLHGMKGVGIELPDSDFAEMKRAGIEILSTEWGMEQDISRVRKFLDQAQDAGLKVVMDGGFSYKAWGFTENDWDRLPKGKLPSWQKQRVQDWIIALRDHPAIYAWDICNEFGENLPSGADMTGSAWPKSRITIEQLKAARADVIAADPSRPIHVRMYGWDPGKMPVYVKSLLDSRIADIVSLNLYSNYLNRGKLQWPTVIGDAGAGFVEEIKEIAPWVEIWISIGVFEYPASFQKPTVAELERDLEEASKLQGIDGITFFCWGPVDQWDSTCNWYLPQKGPELWSAVKKHIAGSHNRLQQ